jgi:hypothetical protein
MPLWREEVKGYDCAKAFIFAGQGRRAILCANGEQARDPSRRSSCGVDGAISRPSQRSAHFALCFFCPESDARSQKLRALRAALVVTPAALSPQFARKNFCEAVLLTARFPLKKPDIFLTFKAFWV